MRRPQLYSESLRRTCSLVLLGGVLLSTSAGAQVDRAAASVPFEQALAVASVDSVWSRINQTYYDPAFHGIDWSAVRISTRRRAEQSRSNAEVRQIIGSMFAQLGDSHFALIPGEVVAQWSDSASGAIGESLGEIGLEFRLLGRDVVVSRVLPRSAAATAGVGLGWSVERLGDIDVADFVRQRLDVSDAAPRRLAELQLPLSLMARTMGATGTTLGVTFRNAGGGRVRLAVPRQSVEADISRFGHLPPQVVRFDMERFNDVRGCVGVVRFSVWMPQVMPRLDDAMVELQRCRGVVLDLRGNVGGVTAMMMGVAGYFLDSAASLGTMTSRGTTLRYLANPRHSDRHGRPLPPYGGAMAILVDGLSVSTSEMFAAGMQDLGRARVFGERTAGQALPAMLVGLPNGDVMQYVVGDYTSSGGRRLESQGVVPDAPELLTKATLIAGRDAPLLAALRWIDERTYRLATARTRVRP